MCRGFEIEDLPLHEEKPKEMKGHKSASKCSSLAMLYKNYEINWILKKGMIQMFVLLPCLHLIDHQQNPVKEYNAQV